MCLLYIVYNFCVDDVNAKMGPVNMLLLPADVGYYDLTSILPEGDAMDTTRLSERGQVVIPKRVRTAHGWEAGLEFIVEDAGDSIKLKPIKLFWCKCFFAEAAAAIAGLSGSAWSWPVD